MKSNTELELPLGTAKSNVSLGSRKSSTTSVQRKVITPPEHIAELETSRSNRDVHICECPAVDKNGQPDYNENCVFEGNSECSS